ncbi:MAG: shikimate dehydrogenase (NADP(+)) [Pirellulaceae bacterium]|nr:MAG: shikimate dehydrogenase (NADP(+)) [Pirellulaceae bacterium]
MADNAVLQPVVCGVGEAVAGNPTQFMVERAFAAAGLDWRFLTLQVAAGDLADALKGIRALGFRGASLFAPHKRAAASLIEQKSDLVEQSGIVTCVVSSNGVLRGENTEALGFLDYVQEWGSVRGKHVWLIGAGAVAQSIAAALVHAKVARVVIANRDPSRAEQLAQKLQAAGGIQASVAPWSTSVEVAQDADILVNATPLGEHDQGMPPISDAALRPGLLVIDVVWSPWRTPWLRRAEERRCRVLDGLGLFVHQVAAAFRLWTGQDTDPRLLREAAEEYLDI